jgi:opacity protein-like surface antigen
MARVLLAASFAVMIAGASQAADFPDPLPVGKIPNVTTLPAAYPPSWVFTNTVTGVEVIDTRGAWSRVRFGAIEAWVPAGALRDIARRG